jgi:DNA-binding IclR family transcriptional regulator
LQLWYYFISQNLFCLTKQLDKIQAFVASEGSAKSAMVEHQEHGPVTRSIARAMVILQSFDETRNELGVTELSQLTGLDKSTVYRLLSALQQGGLIEQNPETTKYHLGLGLLRLAGLAERHLDLPRIVRPHLQNLVDLSQETANLSVMTEDDKLINIACVTSPRRVRNVAWIGRDMPLHAVSGGKVMMAYLSEERLNRILDRGLQSFTEHTITDRERLQRELEEIRQVGYGIAEEELEIGLSAVAAPIWNHERQPVAIISISGPSFRLPKERLMELGIAIKHVADRISEQIGYIR